MAKPLALPSKENQLVIVGPYDSFKATRVQRINLGADIPNTNVDQIGSSTHAGVTVDTPNITFSFSAFDTGIKIFSVLTGTNPAAYPAAGVDIVHLSEIDAVIYIKDPTAARYLKAIHGKRLQIRDFTFSYSVDGDATEDYTAVGSERRYLKNDVIVDRISTGTTTFTLTRTPKQLKNGDYLLSVILDGVYLTEVSGTPATGEYSVSSTTVTTFDSRSSQFIAVYHSTASTAAWTDVSDTTMPASVRGKNIPIEINAVSIPRVQSVTINGTLNVQPVREMGNLAVVGYQRQVPDVNGTLVVLDTDTELINVLMNGTVTTSGNAEWQPGEGCTTSGYPLDVLIYDPCDTDSLLKTVRIPQLTIVGDAFSVNVNGNAGLSFNWKSNTAECIVFEGNHN
jgi:hypothetical protein